MEAEDVRPDVALGADINDEIVRYEAERRRVNSSVRWRLAVSYALTLIAVFLVAYLLNGIAHAQEQWISLPHIIFYLLSILTLIYLHWSAVSPARMLRQSLRQRMIPSIFGFIENISYRHEEAPATVSASYRVRFWRHSTDRNSTMSCGDGTRISPSNFMRSC